MKRIFYFIALMLFVSTTMTSCYYKSIEPEYEGVVDSKPYFWGAEGVEDEPIFPGRKLLWATKDVTEFKMTPVEFEETYDDIFTSDNNPVYFNSYCILQIEHGMSPILYKNWGIKWYENNIEEKYRKLTRDKVCLFELFEMTTQRTIADSLERVIQAELQEYIDNLIGQVDGTEGMPVKVNLVTIGRIKPTDEILDEINNTGVAKQRLRTIQDETKAEVEREQREIAKANADNAYRRALNLSPDQWLRMREIEMMENASKNGATLFLGVDGVPTVPMK